MSITVNRTGLDFYGCYPFFPIRSLSWCGSRSNSWCRSEQTSSWSTSRSGNWRCSWSGSRSGSKSSSIIKK